MFIILCWTFCLLGVSCSLFLDATGFVSLESSSVYLHPDAQQILRRFMVARPNSVVYVAWDFEHSDGKKQTLCIDISMDTPIYDPNPDDSTRLIFFTGPEYVQNRPEVSINLTGYHEYDDVASLFTFVLPMRQKATCTFLQPYLHIHEDFENRNFRILPTELNTDMNEDDLSRLEVTFDPSATMEDEDGNETISIIFEFIDDAEFDGRLRNREPQISTTLTFNSTVFMLNPENVQVRMAGIGQHLNSILPTELVENIASNLRPEPLIGDLAQCLAIRNYRARLAALASSSSSSGFAAKRRKI